MSIKIELSSVFGRYTDNHLVIPVKGSTVGECLYEVVDKYPDLKKIFLDKNGNLLRSYQVFINGESAYPNEMTKPVKDGDKVNIMLLILGG